MVKQTRSVFLYGNPTQCKKESLLITQKEYTKLINHFIEKMIYNRQFYLDLFTNNNQSPLIRSLEKEERTTHSLGSAYGQNAVDHAVKELHNHFTRIRNKLFGYCHYQREELLCYFNSIALIVACIHDRDEFEVLKELIAKEEAKKQPSKNHIDFYINLGAHLSLFSKEQRKLNREEIRSMFYEKLEHTRAPILKRAPLQLDTRVCTIEKAEDIEADFVLRVKVLNSKERIDIPLKTSVNGLRRLNQYKNCSPTITLENKRIKVTIPFEKKVQEAKYDRTLGIDMGITDLFFTSDNKRYGSFSGMVTIYEEVLEPKLKERASLLNKMRNYQKELKGTECSLRKKVLRQKIYNIASMLNGRKNLRRCQRKYEQSVNEEINESIKALFQDIKSDEIPLVVIENLEITEFDRGKKANKRDSSWARGKLAKKFQKKLTWHGIPYVEVDPAYTSKACPKCHNIDANNRKHKSFECTVCKHKSDADYNASINIANRAMDKEIHEVVTKYRYSTKKRHEAIKRLHQKRHEKWQFENKQVTVAV